MNVVKVDLYMVATPILRSENYKLLKMKVEFHVVATPILRSEKLQTKNQSTRIRQV